MSALKAIFYNQGEGRVRAGWRLVLQQVGALVIGFIPGVVLVVMMSALRSAAVGPGLIERGPPPWLVVAGTLSNLVGVVVSVWLAGRFLDRRSFADFGLHFDSRWWLDLCFGLALGAFLITGIFAVQLATGWVAVTDVLDAPSGVPPPPVAILPFVAAFLCVGVYEELGFRGYQLTNLAEGLRTKRLGPRGAIVSAWALSSIVFGLFHALNPNATVVSTLNLMVAGLFLGAGYVLTGELGIPIGLHVTWNLFQGNVYGFPVSGIDTDSATLVATVERGPDLWTGGSFGPEAGLLSLLASFAGVILITVWVRLRYGSPALRVRLSRGLADRMGAARGDRAI